MEALIESIRVALASDATTEARLAGVNACRSVLAALDPSVQQPSRAGASIDASQIATMIGALRSVPPDQLLDLAIARLRAALPPDAATPAATKGIAFHLVPLNR